MDFSEIAKLPPIDSAVTNGYSVVVVRPIDNFPFRATVADMPAGGTLSTLRLGSPPGPVYLGEVYETDANLNFDQSIFRIRGTASSDPSRVSEFWGLTALRIEIGDVAGVVDGIDPYLYGVRVRVTPRVGRTATAIDDVVGVIVSNRSFSDFGTTFNGTEAFYVGNSGDPLRVPEWNSGFAVDAPVGKAFVASYGPIDYGLLIDANVTVNQHAIAIPNQSKISARNGGNSAWLELLRLNATNELVIGNGTNKVSVGNPTVAVATTLEVHALGVADGATLAPQMRIVDTSAFAINVGGELALGGYQDATPTYRTFAAIKSGKENATSGNRAGYLAVWTGDAAAGLVERLRVSSTGVVSLPANGIVGGFFELNELTGDVANGAANTARLYVKDNGAGKTQIVARFNTGAAVVIATEP